VTEQRSYHMSTDDLRRHGHAVIDWIADYLDRVDELPVLSNSPPGEIRSSLPPRPPDAPEPFEAMLADIETVIMPGITHWQSPNFFAFFPANSSGPSILGDLLASGLGVQGMLWSTSPACTELETHVLEWMIDLLGLPGRFSMSGSGGGVIQDSASSATLCALIAARERATEGLTDRSGVDRPLTVYASTQAHSSVEKAIRVAGLGRDRLRLVDVDDAYGMREEALEAAIAEDIAAGATPCMVVATVGTTSSNALDPLRAVGEICRRHGIWLHVDAAMSGTAAICPEFRFVHDGLELADSYCFNPHKWMFVNFDCDCFYVADRSSLIKPLSVLPEYLRNAASEGGAVVDYRDWHIPLGRRFRALKLWFVIRYYGRQGLQHHVRRHVSVAQEFASWVEKEQGFELAAPAPLNLVCFRHEAGDEFNEELLARLNGSGKMYLTHTRLNDRYTIRFCVGQTYTERKHVEQAWGLIRSEAASLSEKYEHPMR
jgi:aromatic-L-amino-acid/L-tryptophan decarboxylase